MQGFGFWVSGVTNRVQGSMFEVLGLRVKGFGIFGSGIKVWDPGFGFRVEFWEFGVWGLGFGGWVWGSGLRVQGFKVEGVRLRVYGFGCTVQALRVRVWD